MTAMHSRMKSNVCIMSVSIPILSSSLPLMSRDGKGRRMALLLGGGRYENQGKGQEKKMSFMYVVPFKCIKTS